MRWIELNLAMVGLSWALLVLPILGQDLRHPAHLVVGSGAFIVVGSVMTTLSALRRPCLFFSCGFFLPLILSLAINAKGADWEVVGAFASLFFVMFGYTKAAAQQRIIAADSVIEVRRLGHDLAVELERAEHAALHDPLTDLFNRRALFQTGLTDPQDRRRKHVLLIDLDHFKQLNDEHGHETGDRVLVAVAASMTEIIASLPGDDHFAIRLGGEEFAMILSMSDPESAHAVAERVRFAVALAAGRVGLDRGKTTASIGMTHYDCGERLDDVFSRADKAMYRAKSSGRNQVRRHAA